jgi:hypothetical protein
MSGSDEFDLTRGGEEDENTALVLNRDVADAHRRRREPSCNRVPTATSPAACGCPSQQTSRQPRVHRRRLWDGTSRPTRPGQLPPSLRRRSLGQPEPRDGESRSGTLLLTALITTVAVITAEDQSSGGGGGLAS